MKDVIVVAHATERKYLTDEYEGQLRDAHIDFHIEPITLFDGIGSMTGRWRLDYWHRMCKKFSGYDRIVFTDAWDVLFFGNIYGMHTRLPPLLISAERNCWPDESLAQWYRSTSPWRYPNPGMMCGYPEYIVAWIETLKAGLRFNADVMDQLAFCQLAASHPELVPLDTLTTLFYVVSADKEDGALSTSLVNARYKTRPYLFHFAGTCHPDPFRALLRGEVSALRKPE
jgi:hypothetical protein